MVAESGDPNFSTSSASELSLTLSSTVPHLEFITIAPVVDWTLGTPPVRSISLTTTAGDSEGVESAILISFLLCD